MLSMLAQRLEFFRTNAYFLRFRLSSGGSGVKIGPKMLGFRSSLFHKNSNPSKKKNSNFLFASVLPLVRISSILHYI